MPRVESYLAKKENSKIVPLSKLKMGKLGVLFLKRSRSSLVSLLQTGRAEVEVEATETLDAVGRSAGIYHLELHSMPV